MVLLYDVVKIILTVYENGDVMSGRIICATRKMLIRKKMLGMKGQGVSIILDKAIK